MLVTLFSCVPGYAYCSFVIITMFTHICTCISCRAHLIMENCWCVFDHETHGTYCILIVFQPTSVCNEYLLLLENALHIVPAMYIGRAVSIVHQCNATCTFWRTPATTLIERETISKLQVNFIHDYSNNMYCLNVYCM